MIIKLVPRIEGKYIVESVFMGPEEGKLQQTGELRMHVGEWQQFGCALLMGASQMKGHLTVINTGGEGSEFFKKMTAMLASVELE